MSEDSAEDGEDWNGRSKWPSWPSISRTPGGAVRVAIADNAGWRSVDISPDHARWLADELADTAVRCEGIKS